jgi:broad specificity phosphatase PhoE
MGSISRDLYTPSPVNSGADLALLPTLYLIRHGQAEHNVNPSNVSRRDTILTATGQLQAADLRAALPASSRLQIGAIVASPLRRALQTALIGFEDLLIPNSTKVIANRVSVNSSVLDATQTQSKPLRLVALPEAQETSDLPCDMGLPVADLVAEFDAINSKWRDCVSFGLVSPKEWGSKAGKWACDREALEKRARETRRWLREEMRQLGLSRSHATTSNGEDFLPGGDCVLVTHGGFLHFLTEDWEGFDVKAGELAYPQTSAPALYAPQRTAS